MLLLRALTMPLPELAGRGGQRVRHWIDRLTQRASSSGRHPRDWARERAAQWLNREPTFFAGPHDSDTARRVVEIQPDARSTLCERAERLLDGSFDLLGYRGLRFGKPIDWQLDPATHKRTRLLHASSIDPLDTSVVGDAKIPWELGRHQWLVTLAQAWRLCGDERYVEHLYTQLDEWRRANPHSFGLHWTSSLEVALRIIAWVWCLHLSRGARSLTPERVAGVMNAIDEHAQHVERYLSTYFSPNTHLTIEALGLVYAGITLEKPRWLRMGIRTLARTLPEQVHPDGVYVEQSTSYQRYTVECCLHLVLLARAVGLTLPNEIHRCVVRLIDFLAAVQWPQGDLPMIGDCDGGWLLPLTQRHPHDPRGVFAIAAVVLQRNDLAWAAKGLQPEVAWMLGSAGCDHFLRLHARPVTRPPTRVFPAGGWIVMRSSNDATAHVLLFDAGPLGCEVSGAHGHADLLAVQCAAFGEPILIDPGTGSYADALWRNVFRSTRFHSTVAIDGHWQATPRGPFAWHSRPKARLRRIKTAGRLHLAAAEHDAYAPIRHHRTVLFPGRRYFVVVDDLIGPRRCRATLHFQFAPVGVELGSDGWVRAQGTAGKGLQMTTFASVPLSTHLHLGDINVPAGWISPDYGQWQPAPLLMIDAEIRPPARLVTILWPNENPTGAAPHFAPVIDHERITGLNTPDIAETLLFDF